MSAAMVAEVREPTVAEQLAAAAVERGLVARELTPDMCAELERDAGTGVVDEETWVQVPLLLVEAMRRAVRGAGVRKDTSCKSCGQPIRWVTTVNGNRMSLDPLPHPMGNVVFAAGLHRAVVEVVGKQDLPVAAGPAFRPHFATCEFAHLHRKTSKVPAPRCRACGGPMDSVLHARGETTHPCC